MPKQRGYSSVENFSVGYGKGQGPGPAGPSVVTGAYRGNGKQAGKLIDIGRRAQYVRIMRTGPIPSPGYIGYVEAYDVWYDTETGKFWFIDYRTVEGKGIVCYPAECNVDNGIVFTPRGFGVTGFSPSLNGLGIWYTYIAILDDGRDRSKERHRPEVLK